MVAWRARFRTSAEAVIYEGGDLTFVELDDRAARLTSARVGSGDRFAYLGLNSAAFLATVRAYFRLGALFTPVSFRATRQDPDPHDDGGRPMTTPLPQVDLDGWEQLERDGWGSSSRLTLRGPDGMVGAAIVVDVVLERSEAGRLREVYPVGEHDVEIRVGDVDLATLTALLRALVPAVCSADPACRRVVFAAPEGDLTVLSAAENAGFRYVVDVDLSDGPVSLSVAEPKWVTAVDMDLDHVPQT